MRSKLNDKARVKEIENEVESELAEAVEFAKNSPQPSVEEFLASVESY